MTDKKKKRIPVRDLENEETKEGGGSQEAGDGESASPADFPKKTPPDETSSSIDVSHEAEENDLAAQLARMTENWQRERAAFINYKRRVEEEKSRARKYACFDLAYDLLRVLDYFDSSISFSENLPEEARSVVLGVEYTVKEMMCVLSAHGVTPVPIEVGDKYDSSLMEAVERRELDDAEAGTIVQVQRRGWKYHDRVLRAAQVVVAAASEKEKDAGEGGEEPQNSDTQT